MKSTIIWLVLLFPAFAWADETPVETGRVSWFGGPKDKGVKPAEGLALFERHDMHLPTLRELLLPFQPKGTSGLARRLNPEKFYISMRWDYRKISREKLREMEVEITANGKTVRATPVDWGPARWTRKKADLSPGLMKALSLETGDTARFRLVPKLRRWVAGEEMLAQN